MTNHNDDRFFLLITVIYNKFGRQLAKSCCVQKSINVKERLMYIV